MEQRLQTGLSVVEDPYQPSTSQPAVEDSRLIKKINSPYQLIEIKHHPAYGNLLVLDNDLQIAESDHDYGRAMVAPLTKLNSLQRVMIMGGGDGGVLQELLKAADSFGWPLMEACMVDIDREVIQSCQQYLPKLNAGAFNDRRAKILVEDVFKFIKQRQNLDAVIYDLTMTPVRDGQTQSAFIEETLSDIANALRPGGMLTMQCCGEGEIGPILGNDNQKLLDEIRIQVDRFFIDRCEQRVAVPSYHEKWTFLNAKKPGLTS